MARHKNKNWNLNDPVGWNDIQAALLMDLRDELRDLNALLNCPKFIAIPRRLDQIAWNTKKRKTKMKK